MLLLRAAWLFLALGWWDKIRGRSDVEKRARNLRRVIERLGGTVVKLGQQLSLRADLLPYAYCRELSQMLDSASPIGFAEAQALMERAIGGPLSGAFSQIDPRPIGSASIACVYQARLNDGRRVAVKVRRPGIEGLFAADLRALDWLLSFLEWTTYFRPGYTRALREDLRNMLFEELDFEQEARYQELFRKNVQADGLEFVSCPDVIFPLSTGDVLVQEYVDGIALGEVIYACENKDYQTLLELAKLGLTPEIIAKRLLLASYWSIHENSFFHADPHPGNIIIDGEGRLVFIDFGACGPSSQRARRLQRQILHRFWREDIEGATRAAIALIDPLPQLDTDELLKRASAVWWRKLYAMRSSHTPWWDRTTASVWLALLEVTREYYIPISLDTLRAMRASLLYDTLAARIWPAIDDRIFAEYEKGERERKAVKLLRFAAEDQGRYHLLSYAADAIDLLSRWRFRAEHSADQYPLRRAKLPNKTSYGGLLAIQMTIRLAALLVVAVAVQVAWLRMTSGGGGSVARLFNDTLSHPAAWTVAALYAWLQVRRLSYRLRDRDE